MRISTKGHYGLRSLIDVALNQANGPVTLNDIARRQTISVKYLWQVINPLRKAGFLNVTRGAKGGYVLAREPHSITMLEVLTALEGPVSILSCLTETSACKRMRSCAARTVWKEANDVVDETLAGITLAKVLSHCPEGQTASYVI